MHHAAALRYQERPGGFERWWECVCGWESDREQVAALPERMWMVAPPESVHEHVRDPVPS